MVRPGGLEALHGFGRGGRRRGVGRLIAVLAPGAKAFAALSALGLGAVVLSSSSPHAPHAPWADQANVADSQVGFAFDEPRWPETLTLDFAGSDDATPRAASGPWRRARVRLQKGLEEVAELTGSGGGAPFLPGGSGPRGAGPSEGPLDVDPPSQGGTGDAPGQPSFGEFGSSGQGSGPGGGSMFDAGAPGGGGVPPSDGGGEHTGGGSGSPPFGPPAGPAHFQPPPIGSGNPAPPMGPPSHIGLGTNPGSPTGPRGAIDCPLAISCLGDSGQGDFPVGDLASIPEPGEWILLIGGFAMLGARMRGLRRLGLAVPGAR